MSIKRIVYCDVCNEKYTEKESDAGFPGWGQLMGIALDGIANPMLCPDHLGSVANFMDTIKEEYR